MVSAVPLPHAFQGEVKYSDGTLIQESLEITAKLGVSVENSTLNNGVYDLIVKSESEGGTIEFFIEDLTDRIGVFTFKSFEITELDFTTTLENPNQESSDDDSGGSSGGGGSTSSGGTSSGSSTIFLEDSVVDDLANNVQIINFDEDQEETRTSPGITGGVIGFVKSDVGIVSLTFIFLILIGAIIIVSLRR